MKQLIHRWYLIAGLALLGLSTHAMADPLGMVAFTNCTPGGGIEVTATTITWLPTAGAELGCIATGLPTDVSYSGGTFTSGTGTISDLPTGSTDPFIVLAGGLLDFSLSSFAAPTTTDGVCSTTVALAAGHSCVPFIGSPFLLSSDGALTTISLVLNGRVTDTGNSSTTPYMGLISFQDANTTAGVASTIDTGGTITDTYSGVLTFGTPAAVPEPTTLGFLSVGLVLIGIPRKRFGTR
jgi:hypothetical protein